jgi:oligoendopeptidase F
MPRSTIRKCRRILFGHYRPWIEDLRKDKPYQLDDKIEQLFHEKSVTGRGAWNRLFDETIAGCASRSTARS